MLDMPAAPKAAELIFIDAPEFPGEHA